MTDKPEDRPNFIDSAETALPARVIDVLNEVERQQRPRSTRGLFSGI